MSIVRIGMSEDDKFGSGYDAIFGTKDEPTSAKPAAAKKKPAPAKKKPSAKKKPAAKKK